MILVPVEIKSTDKQRTREIFSEQKFSLHGNEKHWRSVTSGSGVTRFVFIRIVGWQNERVKFHAGKIDKLLWRANMLIRNHQHTRERLSRSAPIQAHRNSRIHFILTLALTHAHTALVRCGGGGALLEHETWTRRDVLADYVEAHAHIWTRREYPLKNFSFYIQLINFFSIFLDSLFLLLLLRARYERYFLQFR